VGLCKLIGLPTPNSIGIQ
jgi:Ca2+-binding EF-hand superfamily protein